MICPHCAGSGKIIVQVPVGRVWPASGWRTEERPCDNPHCHNGHVQCCDGLQAVCDAIDAVERGEGEQNAG